MRKLRRRRHQLERTVRGVTLDSGALIAYEKADIAVLERLREAFDSRRRITVPTAVIAETWRGGSRSARVAALLQGCYVETLTEALARRSGELLATVPGAAAIDAMVVISASIRGDAVLTSDPDDLSALSTHVEGVKIVAI